MKAKQKELMKKHGTPLDFSIAVWRAWEDFFITMEEAKEAISKYRDEWNKAGGT